MVSVMPMRGRKRRKAMMEPVTQSVLRLQANLCAEEVAAIIAAGSPPSISVFLCAHAPEYDTLDVLATGQMLNQALC